MNLDADYHALAKRLHEDATEVTVERLTGGVSAVVEGLTLRTGEAVERYVVRQQGADWKGTESLPIQQEFELVQYLHDQGLAVPRPIHLEATPGLTPRPCYVMEFIESGDEPPKERRLEAAARFLATLHATPAPAALALPLRDDLAADCRKLPRSADVAALWAATQGLAPMTEGLALLHGDFWPGNFLWGSTGALTVIDWEDAAVGDPASDLAGARLELACLVGVDAVSTFTDAYLAFSGRRLEEFDRLHLWEAYVATAALGNVHHWGLPPEQLDRFVQGATNFLASAWSSIRAAPSD